MDTGTILIENDLLTFELGKDGAVKSLVYRQTGEELLARTDVPFFSVTQERPYNNEVKLAHPCKKTTYPANRVHMENGVLTVGFETAPYEALVEVLIYPRFIAFRLKDFVVHPSDYGDLCMKKPPVAEMRLMALPLKPRARFGGWLNVLWDDSVCVNVLAATPEARVESEERDGYRILTADADAELRLRGTTAGLIVDAPKTFLDSMAAFEEAFDLPRGADSRRSADINASIYWVQDLCPANLDEHIRYAKAGGFRLMLCYYTCFFKEHGYYYNGDYDYLEAYPNGADDVKKLLDRIRVEGITPGLHILQTHIGLKSRYVTPKADHRLHLTRRFTLKKPLGTDEDVVYVEEDPTDTVMADNCRVLRFGTELMSYEGYTTERPYCFFGVRRGAYETDVTAHPAGEIGGILDVSEFGGLSVYIDQSTDLQDEIADRIADVYRAAGFSFIYFDGSEGANVPFAYHIPMAQYRVWRRLSPAPLLGEGAAKAHFSWHMLSGGNAFDIFPPEVFRQKLAEHPMAEAPRMRDDFTRLDFGWWGLWNPGTQCDLVEYGTSRAAAWDCPVTIQSKLEVLRNHPRVGDILEVMRRWEDVRKTGGLTEKQKEMLKDPGTEHTLLINEMGEYELVPYKQIAGDRKGEMPLRAYLFERCGKTYVVYWCVSGTARVSLPLQGGDISILRGFTEPSETPMEKDGRILLTASDRRYLMSSLPAETIRRAFDEAEVTMV